MGVFHDFIPDGEETGAQGSGFVDFVPEQVATEQPEKPLVEVKTEQPEVPAKRGKRKKG